MAESLLCFAGLLTHRLSYGMNAMDLKDIHFRKCYTSYMLFY
jgi:hypothetical protein